MLVSPSDVHSQGAIGRSIYCVYHQNVGVVKKTGLFQDLYVSISHLGSVEEQRLLEKSFPVLDVIPDIRLLSNCLGRRVYLRHCGKGIFVGLSL